ncbi:uncharacterized protein N7482_010293 [Penicillium canariense]|uniref:Uncharacterized protein n=1 Tax=Penicillium canariense TaxID=189055 RepID=A0A9W9LCT6_9EURO|nr:uncharacterized protein N7482_010293 [Penicillium canariense]KAJ5151041.1 hypothetical protein N7482_010293 [Penicillium canariense]
MNDSGEVVLSPISAGHWATGPLVTSTVIVDPDILSSASVTTVRPFVHAPCSMLRAPSAENAPERAWSALAPARHGASVCIGKMNVQSIFLPGQCNARLNSGLHGPGLDSRPDPGLRPVGPVVEVEVKVKVKVTSTPNTLVKPADTLEGITHSTAMAMAMAQHPFMRQLLPRPHPPRLFSGESPVCTTHPRHSRARDPWPRIPDFNSSSGPCPTP